MKIRVIHNLERGDKMYARLLNKESKVYVRSSTCFRIGCLSDKENIRVGEVSLGEVLDPDRYLLSKRRRLKVRRREVLRRMRLSEYIFLSDNIRCRYNSYNKKKDKLIYSRNTT